MNRYAALLLLAACSSETGSSQPATCDKSKVSGTYKLEYTPESGNCAAPPTQLVNTNAPQPAGCTVTSENYSEGDCKHEMTATCGAVRVTQVFRQMSADGSRVEGTQSVTGGSCTGLFRVVGTRQ